MRAFRKRKVKKITIKFLVFIVIFCVIFLTIFFYRKYSYNISKNAIVLLNEKLDKIISQFFTDLITNDVIEMEKISNILELNKNSKDEIVYINYNLEDTYELLTNISIILKDSLNNLENGKIDVKTYDSYLESGKYGLLFNIPLFLGSKNIFVNNLGPRIPVKVNFNGELLTNIKTKVTNYGLNNALLEIYVTVEIDKLLITPINKEKEKFNYDILISAAVINGKVPEFYGSTYEASSGILDIPILE